MLPLLLVHQGRLVVAPFPSLVFFAGALLPSVVLGLAPFLFLVAAALPGFVHVVSDVGLGTG
jgi:hypothetical protein